MKITADTSLLVRAIVEDDLAQAGRARRELEAAELVAVTLPTLCELAWVLDRGYRVSRADIAAAVRGLLASGSVAADRAAAEAGLVQLEAGGDFTDGVIAHQGRWLGGATFVSCDRRAVRLMQARGEPARDPA